jgi:hypothetical protein
VRTRLKRRVELKPALPMPTLDKLSLRQAMGDIGRS